jgi:uncharacterized membrane protein
VTEGAPTRPQADLDRSIARLLTVGTYGSVALLGVGVVLMLAAGIAPLAGGPRFELDLLVDDLVHLRPAGFLWLGIVAVIATPSARVVASLIAFARNGERRMAIVAALILAIIVLSVALGLGTEA